MVRITSVGKPLRMLTCSLAPQIPSTIRYFAGGRVMLKYPPDLVTTEAMTRPSRSWIWTGSPFTGTCEPPPPLRGSCPGGRNTCPRRTPGAGRDVPGDRGSSGEGEGEADDVADLPELWPRTAARPPQAAKASAKAQATVTPPVA